MRGRGIKGGFSCDDARARPSIAPDTGIRKPQATGEKSRKLKSKLVSTFCRSSPFFRRQMSVLFCAYRYDRLSVSRCSPFRIVLNALVGRSSLFSRRDRTWVGNCTFDPVSMNAEKAVVASECQFSSLSVHLSYHSCDPITLFYFFRGNQFLSLGMIGYYLPQV